MPPSNHLSMKKEYLGKGGSPMKKQHKAIILFLLITLIGVGIFFFYQTNFSKEKTVGEYSDCVVGLLPNQSAGSDLVIYTTDTWTPSTLLTLPDVTSDNYAAISNDGKYIAYTTWDDGYIRRYLKVLDTATGEVANFYIDTSAKTEVIEISWMPDNKTLLLIVNDSSQLSYQEIRTLNVETSEEKTLVILKIRRKSQ